MIAIITASGAIVLAGAGYWFTKQRERDAELRKERLAHYKDFTRNKGVTISPFVVNRPALALPRLSRGVSTRLVADHPPLCFIRRQDRASHRSG